MTLSCIKILFKLQKLLSQFSNIVTGNFKTHKGILRTNFTAQNVG